MGSHSRPADADVNSDAESGTDDENDDAQPGNAEGVDDEDHEWTVTICKLLPDMKASLWYS